MNEKNQTQLGTFDKRTRKTTSEFLLSIELSAVQQDNTTIVSLNAHVTDSDRCFLSLLEPSSVVRAPSVSHHAGH